jgi:hypothetical protein
MEAEMPDKIFANGFMYWHQYIKGEGLWLYRILGKQRLEG